MTSKQTADGEREKLVVDPVVRVDPYDRRHFKAMHQAKAFNCQNVLANAAYRSSDDEDDDPIGYYTARIQKERRAHQNEAVLDSLLQDVFMSFYRSTVDFDETVPNPVNRSIVRALLSHPKFKSMRFTTHLNDILSVVATDRFLDELMRRLGEAVQEAVQKLERAVKDRDNAEKFKARLQESRINNSEEDTSEPDEQDASDDESPEMVSNDTDSDSDDADADGSKDAGHCKKAVVDACQDRIDKANEEIGKFEEAFNEAINKVDLDKAVEESLDEAEDDTDSIKQLEPACGKGKGCPGRKLHDLKMQKALADKITDSKKFRQIIKMAGRFISRSIAKRRSDAKSGASEIVDIDTGGSYVRMLPQERILLKHPLAKLDLFRRLTEHGVMEYKMRSRETLAQGPLVICYDQSSSMLSCQKDVWCKSVVLAMVQECSRQKRKVFMIPFESSVLRTLAVMPDTPREQVLGLLMERPRGGTCFTAALGCAIDIISTKRSEWKDADIIFVTDGKDYLYDDIVFRLNKLRKEKDVSVYTIGIIEPNIWSHRRDTDEDAWTKQMLGGSRLLEVSDFVMMVDAQKIDTEEGSIQATDKLLDVFWKVQGNRLAKRPATVEFDRS